MCIREFLLGRRVWFETLLSNPASTATGRARSLHVPGRLVAKGVLLKAGDRSILAVLPATSRIDFTRLSVVLMSAVRLATEDEVETAFWDCERGALPPFGRLYGLATVLDTSAEWGAEVVCAANLRHEGVRMRFRDYEALEAPFRARFAMATDTRRPRGSRRRAG